MFINSKNQPVKFGKPVKYGSSKLKKLVISGSVIIFMGLLVSGGYLSKTKLWWFTNAYGARQVSSAYMSDILKGNGAKAYQASTNTLQKLNTEAQFTSAIGPLKNPSVTINPADYVIKNNVITVVGILKNPSTKEAKLYGVKVANGKVDSLTVVSLNSATALKSQIVALLNK